MFASLALYLLSYYRQLNDCTMFSSTASQKYIGEHNGIIIFVRTEIKIICIQLLAEI